MAKIKFKEGSKRAGMVTVVDNETAKIIVERGHAEYVKDDAVSDDGAEANLGKAVKENIQKKVKDKIVKK